ncbi:MAG: cadherin-like beta sandwich domain-containing protein [Thermoflexaceae bacterium]|nr:cadherin-like beta sandwich domain-containing protein [Thermoflexaceae bacterium]
MSVQKKLRRFFAAFCIFLMMIPVLESFMQSSAVTVQAATQSGKINGDLVNVRVGAGTNNDYLRNPSGNKIQLNTNQEVTILGSANASDGSLWYQVSFYYGGASYTGYVHSEFVNLINNVEYVSDADFESYLNAQGFPESYKDALRNLHAQYPKWTFVADHLNYDWNTAVENESLVGRSLVHSSSISSWKSSEPSAYDFSTGRWYGFDGASWVAASKELVAYCMDPRNFLDSSSIFQFEKLAYDGNVHTLTGVESVVASTFMANNTISNDADGTMTYAQAILNAASVTGVSPYHLASRIIQEIGTSGGSQSISGAVSGYEGLYNYYNQGAYAHDGRTAIINGLIYARDNGWTSRYKAIVGGAEYIGKNYINVGQNTLYYEKFDFVGTPYTHQYMTNILAPSSEAANVAKGYTEEMRKNLNLVFVIPVFNNMPEAACAKPAGDGSPNNILNSLTVEGYNLTPTYSKYVYEYDVIVGKDVAAINVGAAALDNSAKVEGTGQISLAEGNNTITIKVTAANGDVRNYILNVYRGDVPVLPPSGNTGTENSQTPSNGNGSGNTETTSYTITTNYKLDETKKYITGIEPGSMAVDVLNAIKTSEGEAYILNADGTINAGTVATGNQLLCVDKNGKEVRRYIIVIYGDVDGNGSIDILDTLYVKRHVMLIDVLSGAYLEAADADRMNDGVSVLDLLYIKRHVVGISKITQ